MAIKLTTKTRNSIEEAAASLNKAEVKEVQKTAEQLRIEELVGEIVRLKSAADDSKKVITAYESSYKTLKDFVDGAPEEEYTFETEDGAVIFGAESNKTEITDMAMVFKILGKATFLKVCTVPVSKLKDYMSKAELEQCTKVDRSGSRSLKAVIPSK